MDYNVDDYNFMFKSMSSEAIKFFIVHKKNKIGLSKSNGLSEVVLRDGLIKDFLKITGRKYFPYRMELGNLYISLEQFNDYISKKNAQN